jgi:hypothetical protein
MSRACCYPGGMELLETHAIEPPVERRSGADAALKPRRSRVVTLTRVDKRLRLGKRIAELTAMYLAALGDADLSPLKRLKVDEAAQLKAVAEKTRGAYLREGEGSLDDIVRIERKAASAERALGIVERAPKPKTLADVLAGRG